VAKKTRTPPPPRRVQAPKTRVEPRDAQRTRLTLLVVAALGFVGLAAAIGLFAFGGGGSSVGVTEAMREAGCTFRTVKSPPHKGDHSDVPTLEAKATWNTTPPSNGMHYGRPAIWGFYEEAVNPRLVVHNLEHGGVAIWWGSKVPAETIQKLHDFYSEKGAEAMIGTLYPKLGNKIALTAWTGNPNTYFENGDYGEGRIAICPRYDEKAFRAFRDAFRGKGPEPIPPSANKPGT
jgi:hypothetical protein